MDKEIIKQLANSDYGKYLVKYLKEIQGDIADVRYGEYSSEARLLAIKAIEEKLIAKLNAYSNQTFGSDEGVV